MTKIDVEKLEISLAFAEESAAIIAILEEAGAWRVTKGVSRWKSFSEQEVARKIADGEFYVARFENRPIAVFRLLWTNAELWRDADFVEESAYFHSFAVSRQFAGRNVGLRVIECACELAKTRGERFLRLDCLAENTDLCAYYLRAGFVSRGLKTVEGWKFNLFEKSVS